MGALLEHAACVVVASRSEGFSLPVVEALARGTAVVVPAGTVQAEVAGPVAHVAASCATEVLAQAILQACASASESTLRADRQQYAARYSWDDTARRWEDAWLQM
jgi:glycosyltransferase involved in cell wall biosynthesis